MNLLVVGMNHRTAPVEVRECLAPAQETVEPVLRRLAALSGLEEAVLVSTCNRVEVVAAGPAAPEEAAPRIVRCLADGQALDEAALRQGLYVHAGGEAVRHLFRVAASLDSMVVGEPQILGQIKDAYRAAAGAGSTGAVLNRLMHKTFQVAKRVRSETMIGGAAVSVAFAAVELARKIFDELHGLRAMLIGAGEMAELAAEHLVAQGVAGVTVVNRTLERAVELAHRWHGRAAALDDLGEELAQADIVISSTGATAPVVTKAMAKAALKRRRGRPIFFIDIAVPRDIDPKAAGVDGCYVYDMDDLEQVVQANRANRAQEARAAERIVAEEVVKFQRWLEELSVAPTIARLTGKAEAIRVAELERTLKDLGGACDTAQAEALDRLTRALVKKLMHDPIMFLKGQGHAKAETRRDQLALVRRVFDLSEDEKA